MLLCAMVRGIASIFSDPAHPPRVVRDPADDYLVALARSAQADAVVTADRDLLDHDGLEPPAVSAHEACAQLGLDHDGLEPPAVSAHEACAQLGLLEA